MNAEEFLNRAYRIDQQIQSKILQLDRLRSIATGTGLRFADDRVRTSGPASRIEDAVIRIVEEEEAIHEEIDRLVETKRQIREVIDQVEDVTCRLILEKRNLLFETWPKICEDMRIGPSWARLKYREAIQTVQEILDEEGEHVREI